MIVRTDPLSGSALSQLVMRGADDWSAPPPITPAAWAERCTRVARRDAWRAALAPAFGTGVASAARARLDAADVVVTTGQQPGLLGGPLMSLAKALAALGLADALERTTGHRVAPIFWAATDDADFDEAAVVHVAAVGGARVLRLARRPPPGTPMSQAPLIGVDTLWPAFADACGSAVWGTLRDTIADAYRPERSVGDAYLMVLRAVLEPLGVSVLDAAHPAVRGAGRELLRAAATDARAVASALESRNEALRAAGHDPQVTAAADLSLVFVNEGTVKRRLTIDEATEAGADADLSATVLLRPVMERAILPTVAYVGGPAELAYFAQLTAVADALGAERPVAVPRWSTTIIEPRVTAALERLGATPDAVEDRAAAERHLAQAHLPPAIDAALHALDDALATGFAALDAADAGALIPPRAAVGARGAVRHSLDRLRRRYLAAVKRQEADLMQHIGTASGALYPGGQRQERVLSYAQLLVRHGEPLLDAMRAQAAVHAASLVGADTTAPTPAETV